MAPGLEKSFSRGIFLPSSIRGSICRRLFGTQSVITSRVRSSRADLSSGFTSSACQARMKLFERPMQHEATHLVVKALDDRPSSTPCMKAVHVVVAAWLRRKRCTMLVASRVGDESHTECPHAGEVKVIFAANRQPHLQLTSLVAHGRQGSM